MRTSLSHHEAYGTAILDRLAALKVPAPLKPTLKAFSTAHSMLLSTSDVAHAARDGRDDALHSIAGADGLLTAALGNLADGLVTAKLGKRTNPFAGYSTYSLSKLCELGYAHQVAEARALMKKLGKVKGAPTGKLAAAAKRATAVESALRSLAAPQAKLARSLGTRDADLPLWTKALSNLKKAAAAAWMDDVPTYDAIFAPPEAVAAPVQKRTKKAKAGGTPASGAAAPGSGAGGTSAPPVAAASELKTKKRKRRR